MKNSNLFAATIGAFLLALTVSLASAQDSLLWLSGFGAEQDQAVAAGEPSGRLTPTFDIGGRPFFAAYTALDSTAEVKGRNWQEKLVRGCLLGFRAVVDAIEFAVAVTTQALDMAVGGYAPDR